MTQSYSPSIAAQKGRAHLLKVADGSSPPNYTTVAGVRTTGMVINNNPVDITNKASAGFRELLPDGGVQQVNFTAAGLRDSTANAPWASLQSAAINRTLIELKLVSGSGDSFTGWFAISQFQRDGTYNDAETFSLTAESDGEITYSPTGT